MPPSPAPSDLEPQLLLQADWLRGRIQAKATWLLRVDGLDDLVQDVHLRALKAAPGFEYRGEGPLRAWLAELVQQSLADRRRYWAAAKRNAGYMVRLSAVGSPSTIAGRGAVELATESPGPKTWAEARDGHAFAMRAVAALLPRDQQLIEWLREGAADHEIAERLELSVEAAARARLRATERFRRAYELLVRASA